MGGLGEESKRSDNKTENQKIKSEMGKGAMEKRLLVTKQGEQKGITSFVA